MQCEHVTETTPAQKKALQQLERDARRLVMHMHTSYPNMGTWESLSKGWNGKVLLGPTPYRASFDVDSGCLLVGVPGDGGTMPILNARMILAMSSGATRGKMCSDIHASLVSEASSKLNIDVAIGCDECSEHGMCDTSKCTSCTWIETPEKCSFQRSSWPELLGSFVKDIPARFPGRTVEYATWDSMHYKPAARDTIRVTYDARTGMIVHPSPHVGTVNIPLRDAECFIKPDGDSTVGCIGAPQVPPPEWSKYIGSLLPDAIDSLRMRYPHATIESSPSNAMVSADRRPDRIRVMFNVNTGIVTSIPTIG